MENSKDKESVDAHYKYYDWNNNVLNGIAYDARSNTFLLTGKMWNHVYRVKLNYPEKDEL